MTRRKPVSAAYRRFVDARVRRLRRDRPEGAQIEMWRATVDALRAYATPDNEEPFPKEIAFELAESLEAFLCTRQLPKELRLVLKGPGGGRYDSPALIEDKRCAVRYILAARAGWLEDPKPVETVLDWFGAKQEVTVNRWLRQYKSRVSLSDFGYDHLSQRERVELAEWIILLARKSAEHWKQTRPKPKAKAVKPARGSKP